MNKKRVLLICITVFIFCFINVYADSEWSGEVLTHAPYVWGVSGSGFVIAEDDAFLNPFSYDKCSALTASDEIYPEINHKIAVSTSMTYSSNGTLRTISSATKTQIRTAGIGQYPNYIDAQVNSSVTTGVNAYGTHTITIDGFTPAIGHTDTSF